ncbi:MAG: hypothetical protein JWR34_2027 [Mycobacterium sp.]|nr:hypothetical protein [Mycobacterium sp.]
MNVSARSYVAAGIAALTAGVIAIPTSAELPAALTPLSASVQKEQVALLAAAGSFTTPIKVPVAFVVLDPPHAVAPNSSPGAVAKASPTAVAAGAPSAQAALVGFPGIQNAIINAYNVINPWVDYGVNVAQYAVGWIPVASFFAPQIGIVYYSLIEPIVTSAVYNTAYVLGGSIGLVQGISNVINDSINAGIGFVNAEINWALSFLPPLPPIPFAAAQTTALKVAAGPTTQATTDTVGEKHEPGVATSAEPTAKPAADPAAPEAPKSPTQPATGTATEPATPKPETEPATEAVTPKPEAEPVKKPGSTTTRSSGGLAAQGEVRGGTQSATDSTKTPAAKPDASTGDKGDGDAASTANKPAESPHGTKTTEASKTGDAEKTGDANNSVGSAHGA